MVTLLISRLLDCIVASLLAIYAFMIIGPLGILRGPLVFERIFWYIRVLIPIGMLSKGIRVAIDWRLGHFDVAIAQADDIIYRIESFYQKSPRSKTTRRVLGDLYTVLARSYLHKGHIDEAMQVILRAKKVLDMDRLIGLSGVDAKTAHLVRAGLAAGKLLDGSGLATLFVKTDAPTMQRQRQQADKRHTAKATDAVPNPEGAKIIPFPSAAERAGET